MLIKHKQNVPQMALLECFEHVSVIHMFGVTVSRAQQRCLWTEGPHPLPWTLTDLSHAQVQSAPKDDVKPIRVVRQSDPIVLISEPRRRTWSLRQSPSRRRARALLKRTLRWRTARWNWTARLSPTNQHQFGGRVAQVLTGVRREEHNPNLLVNNFPA